VFNPLKEYEDQVRLTIDQAIAQYFQITMDVIDENYEGKTLSPDEVYDVLCYVLDSVHINLEFKDLTRH
jgi:hypothetical protein